MNAFSSQRIKSSEFAYLLLNLGSLIFFPQLAARILTRNGKLIFSFTLTEVSLFGFALFLENGMFSYLLLIENISI